MENYKYVGSSQCVGTVPRYRSYVIEEVKNGWIVTENARDFGMGVSNERFVFNSVSDFAEFLKSGGGDNI